MSIWNLRLRIIYPQPVAKHGYPERVATYCHPAPVATHGNASLINYICITWTCETHHFMFITCYIIVTLLPGGNIEVGLYCKSLCNIYSENIKTIAIKLFYGGCLFFILCWVIYADILLFNIVVFLFWIPNKIPYIYI